MGGIIGGVKSLVTGPEEAKSYSATDSYNDQVRAAEAQAKYGTYGVDSSLGGMELVQNDDGTYSKKFTDSTADVTRGNLINQGLTSLSMDPTDAENAYYDRATRLLGDDFNRATENLDSNLINRGIGVGNEQYNEQMQNLQESQQGTLSDIANQAVFAGQDLLGSQVGNINNLSAGRDIYGLSGLESGTGASITSQLGQAIASQNSAATTNNAQDQQGLQQGVQLAAMFSDKRLKENLEEVAKLENGLSIYVGNYTKESGLDMRPQLFLIAQEVREVNPEAVTECKDGYLMVNYKEAVKC